MSSLAFSGSRLGTKASEEAVIELLQCVNQKRLGYAEGSMARHSDGRTARRYYSDTAGRLRWLITEKPGDGPVEIDALDELPEDPKWQIVYEAPWEVIQK